MRLEGNGHEGLASLESLKGRTRELAVVLRTWNFGFRSLGLSEGCGALHRAWEAQTGDEPPILDQVPPVWNAPGTKLSTLIPIYLEKREALLRFFTARLGSPAAAEDLVQDIYLKLSTLDADAPVQNEVGFLYRLGSNLMLDRLRQQRRSAARDGRWREINTTFVAGEEVADEPTADEVVTGRQRLSLMLAAVEALPPAQRQAFRLHKLEGRSQAETAAALGCSVSSVEKYIRAAMKQLMERLS